MIALIIQTVSVVVVSVMLVLLNYRSWSNVQEIKRELAKLKEEIKKIKEDI